MKTREALIRIIGIPAVALLLVLSGCGGSEDTSGALTKAAFVKQGNALCKKEREERQPVAEAALAMYLAKKTPEARQKAVDVVVGRYEQMTSHLAALGAPEGQEAKIEDIIESMEDGASRAKANPKRALEGFYPFRQANEAVEAYGLTQCTA